MPLRRRYNTHTLSLLGVDWFSVAKCHIKDADVIVPGMSKFLLRNKTTDDCTTAQECVSEHGKSACAALGGDCVTEQDGYYIVSAICMGFGILSVLFFLIPTARKLQGALRGMFDNAQTLTITLCSGSGEQVEDLFLIGRCRSRISLYSRYILGFPEVYGPSSSFC